MTKPLEPKEKYRRQQARLLRKRRNIAAQKDYNTGVEEGLLRAARFLEREAAYLIANPQYLETLWERYTDRKGPRFHVSDALMQLFRAYVMDTSETLLMGNYSNHRQHGY